MQIWIIKQIWPNETMKCPPGGEQSYPPQIGDTVKHPDGRTGEIRRIVRILSLGSDKVGYFECFINCKEEIDVTASAS